MSDYPKYIIRLLDDLNGCTKREVFKVIDEDEEFYLCEDPLTLKDRIVFNKSEIYSVIDHKGTITLFGIDEDILIYILLKVYENLIQKKEKNDEVKMILSKLSAMKKKYKDILSDKIL